MNCLGLRRTPVTPLFHPALSRALSQRHPKRSAARHRMAALLLMASCGLATPVLAQGENCVETLRRCLQPCSTTLPALRSACVTACRQQNQSCRTANPGSPLTPSQERRPSDVSPVPTLSAPMTAGEIAQALSAVQAIQQRHADGVRAARQAQLPPECQMGQRGYNPMACTMARERGLASAPDERADIPRLLLPLQPSLQLDLAALPTAPVERIHALQAVRVKYQAAEEFLRSLREGPRPQGPGANALVTLMGKFAEPRVLALKQAQLAPEVKQAWMAGQLPSELLALDYVQRIEWDADRQTQTLLQALRAEMPGVRLFADRDGEADASARERTQAASFASWGQPSDTEIGLALLRAHAANNGRQVSAYEAERSLPGSVLLAMAGAPLIDVQRVLHVQKAQPCVREGQAWKCSARLWLHVFQRGDALRLAEMAPRNPALALMAASNAQFIKEGGRATELRLLATREGFQAPELTEMLRARDQRRLEDMDDTARRAACRRLQDAGNLFPELHPDCKPK